jgi:hypothetical protein
MVVEVGTQVGDYSIWEAKAVYNLVQKVENSISLWASHGFDFDPFCKLVDGHEYSVEAS